VGFEPAVGLTLRRFSRVDAAVYCVHGAGKTQGLQPGVFRWFHCFHPRWCHDWCQNLDSM